MKSLTPEISVTLSTFAQCKLREGVSPRLYKRFVADEKNGSRILVARPSRNIIANAVKQNAIWLLVMRSGGAQLR